MPLAPFLSIVVPFHDSARKCGRLLGTLSKLVEDDVEVILVDDGSRDGTPQLLRKFADQSAVTTKLVQRSRGGPGAARNSGLSAATGRFVWFVDSDDDISLGAIAKAKTFDLDGIDLIAWDYDDPETHCPLSPGVHETSEAPAPPAIGQTFVAKWFARDFLNERHIRFPEFCAYESAFEAFILPLHVLKYLKSDFRAYTVVIDSDSVTRDRRQTDPRFYDRLENACLGIAYVLQFDFAPDIRRRFEKAFVNFCLWYNVRLTKMPGPMWLRAVRVMRRFRDEASRFGIRQDPFAVYEGRRRSRVVLRFLWTLSKLLPSQDAYFRALRMRDWGGDIAWEEPTAVPGWSRSAA